MVGFRGRFQEEFSPGSKRNHLEMKEAENPNQAPVVRRVHNTTHCINHYPLGDLINLDSTYLLEINLSSTWIAFFPSNNWGKESETRLGFSVWANELKNPQPEMKFVIHHFHKGGTIYYSFAFMVIRPTALILKRKFFWNVLTLARREGLIRTWTKEYLIQVGRHYERGPWLALQHGQSICKNYSTHTQLSASISEGDLDLHSILVTKFGFWSWIREA